MQNFGSIQKTSLDGQLGTKGRDASLVKLFYVINENQVGRFIPKGTIQNTKRGLLSKGVKEEKLVNVRRTF